MKKKLMIGLAAMALATGIGATTQAFFGTAKAAIETSAAKLAEDTVFYCDVSAIWDWQTEHRASDFRVKYWNDAGDIDSGWPGVTLSSDKVDGNIVTVELPEGAEHFILSTTNKQSVDIDCATIYGSTYTFTGYSGDNATGAFSCTAGWYLVGDMNSWGTGSIGGLSQGTADGIVAKWDSVQIDKDDGLKVRYINSNYSTDDSGWKGSSVMEGTSWFHGGNDDNIVCDFSGTYNVALTSAYAVRLTPTDATVVSKFVSTITEDVEEAVGDKDADERAADCTAKYNAHKDAYGALTDDQLELLEANYPDAYNAFQGWMAAATGSNPARQISAVAQTSSMPTIAVVTITSIALAAAAGYFFYRKKHQAE